MKIAITGASRGIGKKIASYLVSKKHRVINISRTKSNVKKIINYKCDITNKTDVKAVFKKIGYIDILINNAGITNYSNNPIENFEKTLKTNLFAPFYCSIFAIENNNKKKLKILNIGSINAYQAFPNNPGYVSSKGGLKSLTQSIALDFVKYRVTCNTISLGYFKEGMSQKSYVDKSKRKKRLSRIILDRWGDASDIYGMIEYLISKKSDYVTGQDFVIDGGWLAKGL